MDHPSGRHAARGRGSAGPPCGVCAAAKGGSEAGCYNLADCFANGLNGLRENARAATRWYRAMESATVRDADDDARDNAAEWLREHAVES